MNLAACRSRSSGTRCVAPRPGAAPTPRRSDADVVHPILDPSLFGTHSLRRTKVTLSTDERATFARFSCSLATPRWRAQSDTSASRLTMRSPSPSRSTSFRDRPRSGPTADRRRHRCPETPVRSAPAPNPATKPHCPRRPSRGSRDACKLPKWRIRGHQFVRGEHHGMRRPRPPSRQLWVRSSLSTLADARSALWPTTVEMRANVRLNAVTVVLTSGPKRRA
jgi:hypothetical protein